MSLDTAVIAAEGYGYGTDQVAALGMLQYTETGAGRRHDPGGWGGVEWTREEKRKPLEPDLETLEELTEDSNREDDIVLMKFALHFLQADLRSDDELMILSAVEFLKR